MSNSENVVDKDDIDLHATDRPTSYITTGALGAVFLKVITDEKSDNKNIETFNTWNR